MITRLDKVTLYVESQDDAKKFWIEKIGFKLAFEQQMGPTRWIEVAPEGENKTTLVLYSKAMMMKQNPSMVNHPSIIFSAKSIEIFWNDLKNKGVTVENIQNFPYGKMFSFKDLDGNSYMVRE